jgi:methionine biosynthesis protein MetW
MSRLTGGVLRPDLEQVAAWIGRDSRVLDLGCGDGALLDWLARERHCSGYGVEIDDAQVLACTSRGVDVIQQNIEQGLDMFGANQFQFVVLSMAIMATQHTERVVREMGRIGQEAIISFPNFGHWRHLWSLALGRMPMSRALPFEWYNTPNLHLATILDFENFLRALGMTIVDAAFLDERGRRVSILPAKRASTAIYRFRPGPTLPDIGA